MKPEQQFVDLANKWLAANLGNEEVRTTVWNGISAMCRAIVNEKHDAIAIFIAETQK